MYLKINLIKDVGFKIARGNIFSPKILLKMLRIRVSKYSPLEDFFKVFDSPPPPNSLISFRV